MSKKLLILIGLGVVILSVGAVLAIDQSNQTDNNSNNNLSAGTTEPQSNTAPTPGSSENAKGRYISYSEESRSDSKYNRTILFFHAPWCPQCRAFEKNITASEIPEGTQILKTDYDSSTELKKKYGVTLQTTFVSVEPDGSQVKKWVGYTSNHTLEALLSQF